MSEKKKDYLSMLADEADAKQKPASFSEEHFEKVEKPKVNLNPKWVIGGVVGLVVALVAAYFIFFAPKITMPDFLGKTKNDVGIWAKQEGLKTTDMIMTEEFNFEVEEGKIVSQSVDAGKKVKNGTVITFVVSKGADPDEKIDFPDIKSMTYGEINDWISKNKLSKVKVNTVYHDTIEKDVVISFDLKSVNENNFTRGTNLTISVSKGPQPAGTITMEDFVKKEIAVVETFAKTKKIELEKVEVYNDDIASGLVVSQSVKSGETMKQGDVLTVTVSKGKAVSIPDFSTYTKDMLDVWAANKENNVTIIKKEVYSDKQNGSVISQSLKAGSKVDQGSVLELTISLARPRLQTSSREWLGQDYLKLQSWVDDVWSKGGKIEIGNWLDEVDPSAEYPTPGQITKYICTDKDGNELPNKCDGLLPINAKISYQRVKADAAPIASDKPDKKSIKYDSTMELAMFKAVCEANGITVVEAGTGNTVTVYRADGTKVIASGETISEGETIIIKLS